MLSILLFEEVMVLNKKQRCVDCKAIVEKGKHLCSTCFEKMLQEKIQE